MIRPVETAAGHRFASLGVIFPAYFGTVALLAFLSAGAFPEPWPAGGLFAGLAVLSLGAHLVYRRSGSRGPLVALAGATGLLFATYTSLGMVLPWLLPEGKEWFLLQADRDWLGYEARGTWAGLEAPLLTDFLQVIYVTFYGFPLVLAVALCWKRDWWGLLNGTDRVVLAFLLVYCGYLLVPAQPPDEVLAYPASLPSSGLREVLHQEVVLLSWTQRDCFPSGHTMLALYLAWLAWQRAREAFWLLGPWALLTVVATLYLRYHYLTDILVGILACLAWAFLADRLFGSFRRGPEPARARARDPGPGRARPAGVG